MDKKLTKAQFIATFCLYQLDNGCSFDPFDVWGHYRLYVEKYDEHAEFFKKLEDYFIKEKIGEEF